MSCDAPWAKPTQAVQEELCTGPAGLTDAEVEKRRARYGFNELSKPPGKSIWAAIAEQFDDTLVKVGKKSWPASPPMQPAMQQPSTPAHTATTRPADPAGGCGRVLRPGLL